MKQVFILLIFLFSQKLFGQTSDPDFHQVTKAFQKIYTHSQGSFVVVFDMGKYLDKAGIGSSIRYIDTLHQQPDNSYKGKEFLIDNVNNQLYIKSLTGKKHKKYKLEIPDEIRIVLLDLNNAYYLDNYFAMSKRLNKRYELNHFDFRGGFYSWKQIAEKEFNYLEFRNIADSIIKKMEDSVSKRQDQLVAQTRFLIDNVDKMSYTEFKDSINRIPAEYAYQSSYYKNVVREISKSKQDYVIALYKDSPENRTLIEFAVEDNAAVRQELKSIQKRENKLTKKK